MGKAFENFKDSLNMSTELRKVETKHYSAIPKIEEQPAVKGIRGGIIVLIVASFEFFIKELFEEKMKDLVHIPAVVDFNKLPDNLKVKTVYATLEKAMKGNPFEEKLPKKDKITDIQTACKIIVSSQINPSAFSNTGSNPNASTVRAKFKEAGLSDIFKNIKEDFEKKWRSAVAETFIEDKLNEIVTRRHIVAHTAKTLDVTRSQLNESIKFLKILAEILDKKLEKHIRDIMTTAKI